MGFMSPQQIHKTHFPIRYWEMGKNTNEKICFRAN